MIQETSQEALETARRAHELAVKALDASGNETWNVLLGAGLALAGTVFVLLIERAVRWFDGKRHRDALVYWFAYESVSLASNISGIARLIGHHGLPFSTQYDMVPLDNVSKLIDLRCSQELLEAVFELQGNSAGTFSMVERIDKGFQRDQPGQQRVSYGWAAVDDVMRSFIKRFESARSTSNVLITGVRKGAHKKHADALASTLSTAIVEYEAGASDYQIWKTQEIRNLVTTPRTGPT